MNDIQYEELCRLYIARRLRLLPTRVRSVRVPNAQRPGLPTYKHQIDLYWETEDALAHYLNIANAKWRGRSKVSQPEILLLQQVREKVAAHKAVMITNTGFTSGAIAAAYDGGIGLHLVQPNFDTSQLSKSNRYHIHAELVAIERETASLFRAKAAYKSTDLVSAQDEAAEELDPEAWLTSQLQLRLDYLRFLATQEYPVSVSEIRELDREIAQRKIGRGVEAT